MYILQNVRPSMDMKVQMMYFSQKKTNICHQVLSDDVLRSKNPFKTHEISLK